MKLNFWKIFWEFAHNQTDFYTVVKGVLCQKVYFWGVFCLDHLKLEVVLQNCWISLITDYFENLRKSEWVSSRTPHQQNESWSWKSSKLHKDHSKKKGCYRYTAKPYERCIPVKNCHFFSYTDTYTDIFVASSIYLYRLYNEKSLITTCIP